MTNLKRAVFWFCAFWGCLLFPMVGLARPPIELISGPHIEPPTNYSQVRLLAPVGCTNLALNRKVTASTNQPSSVDLGRITDGEKQVDPEDNVLLIGRNTKWIQIDLERRCQIQGIAIWHDYSYPEVYRGVVVQSADDPEFTNNVCTLFNNDYDDLNGLGAGTDLEYYEKSFGKLIDAHGIKARYLRFYSCGTHRSKLSCYTEIEVWGLPAASAVTSGDTNERALAPLPIKLPTPPFW